MTDAVPLTPDQPSAGATDESRRARAMLRMVVGGVFLSFAPVLVKLVHVGPTPAAFYRMAISGVVLGGWVLATRRRWWAGRGHLIMAVLASSCVSIGSCCLPTPSFRKS